MKTIVLLALLSASLHAQHAQEDDRTRRNPAIGNAVAIAAGEKMFNEGCAGCHGPGGTGGRGPNLAMGRVMWHKLSDQGTFDTIRKGVPSGGMPPTPGPDEKVWQLTAYVVSLRAPAAEFPLPGDAKAGEPLFWGKGGCNECHSIRGRGGKIGPDLTDVGGTRSVAMIRNAVLNPGGNGSVGFEKASVRLKNGQSLEGVLKNRNNYSLQLLDASGKVHLLSMIDVASLQIAKDSAMPRDIAKRFSKTELENLIAYLGAQSARPVNPAGN